MEGLEFLKDMAGQQKEIIARTAELNDLIKKHLNRPSPAPEIRVDAQDLARQMAALMGDPEGRIKQANSEFAASVRGFLHSAQSLPSSVPVRGAFYGFTSWKPFLLYLLMLLACSAFSGYTWHRNKQLLNYIERNHAAIQEFKADYPKLGKKYLEGY